MLVAGLIAAMCGAVSLAGSAAAAAPVTYSASQTIPVPPASAYAGSGGGDGWAIALSSTNVFNVFHHSSSLTVACHHQVDAAACWAPRTVTDAAGKEFATSGHPGMWFDQTSNLLYVYATREDDTAGVVCIDTIMAATAVSPFCGFTALTAIGAGPLAGGISGISEPVVSGNKWYAVNYVSGVPAGPAANALLCFDLTSLAACGSQPFALGLGAGAAAPGSFPEPQVATIGGRVIVAAPVGTDDRLGCFDPTTPGECAGSWPVTIGTSYSYTSQYGAPFPLLDATGAIKGLCLPTGVDPCYSLTGAVVATPSGLAAAIPGTSGWNGGAVVLGPRVYVPNGNGDEVDCYSAATNATCPNFPKALAGLQLLYTVNPDPARPTCLWVNADGGGSQIQNFDAYTGGACGQGPIRVLASSFVVASPLCQPATYTSLQVTEPARSGYDSGSIAFQDSDAHQISGVADATLDATGTAALTGKDLSTNLGLPQFLITLAGPHAPVGEVIVQLVWTGADDPSCVKPGTTVTGGGGGGSGGGSGGSGGTTACGDGVVFIGAAGSGEHFKTATNPWVSRELKAVYDGIQSQTGSKKVGLRMVNYSPASVDVLTAALNKIKPTSKADFVDQAQAKGASNLSRYIMAKDSGVAALWAQYQSVRADCPANTKIVLGGFSQGAAVVHDFLDQLAGKNDVDGKNAVVAAVLIADPERLAHWAVPERSSAPAASSGVCQLLAAVLSCSAPDPVSDVGAPFAARSVSICSLNDVACDSSDVFNDLQNAWDSTSARNVLLTKARKVHGAYAALPATKAAGQSIGLHLS